MNQSLIVRHPVKQTSTTSETATAMAQHPFERRVNDVKLSKMDINYVIMDYLVNEGYPEAAKRFAAEANIQPPPDPTESIEERVAIRNDLLAGKIQQAIERINDLDPELLDKDFSLHFSLLRLQLIELIRPCASDPNADITEILNFAQTSLAPRAPTNQEFKVDLERTMALLIYSNDPNPPPAIAALLDKELRRTIASRVNESLLRNAGLDGHAKLRSLVQLRAWTERKARETDRDLPESLDIWSTPLPTERNGAEDTTMSQDGAAEAEAMAT